MKIACGRTTEIKRDGDRYEAMVKMCIGFVRQSSVGRFEHDIAYLMRIIFRRVSYFMWQWQEKKNSNHTSAAHTDFNIIKVYRNRQKKSPSNLFCCDQRDGVEKISWKLEEKQIESNSSNGVQICIYIGQMLNVFLSLSVSSNGISSFSFNGSSPGCLHSAMLSLSKLMDFSSGLNNSRNLMAKITSVLKPSGTNGYRTKQ